MAVPQRRILLLLGKTGHGKSATGNSILGLEEFGESDNFESCTVDTKKSSVDRLNHIITVVDGPGLMDTNKPTKEDIEMFGKKWGRAIQDCSEGVDAFLFLMKYMDRYTKEQKETLTIVKELLGKNVLRDHGIIIFTFGELFDQKYTKNEKSFDTWLQEQKADISELLGECSYRAILFRNANRSDDQVKQLLQMVGDLSNENGRYKGDILAKVQQHLKRMEVEEKAPEIRSSIQLKIDLLITEIGFINTMQSLDSNAVPVIQKLRSHAMSLDKEISELDQNTGVLESLRERAREVMEEVNRAERDLSMRQPRRPVVEEELENRFAREARLTEREARLDDRESRIESDMREMKANLQATQTQLRETKQEVSDNVSVGLAGLVDKWVLTPIWKWWTGSS